MILRLLLVGVGGFAGAVARYVIDTGITEATAGFFPYGTLTVNSIGSFFFGILGGLVLSMEGLTEEYQLLLMTGFLGSLTTFSTFSYENVQLLEKGLTRSLLLNIAGNVILCLFLAWVGLFLARRLT